jgi:hypothetical protein
MRGYTKVKKKLDNGITVRISDAVGGYMIGIKRESERGYTDLAHYFDWDVTVKKYKEVLAWAGEFGKGLEE